MSLVHGYFGGAMLDLFVEDDETYEVSARRAAFVAGVLGIKPPSRLVDEENCPTEELIDFVMKSGASLDFIFLGDLRSMIARSAAR